MRPNPPLAAAILVYLVLDAAMANASYREDLEGSVRAAVEVRFWRDAYAQNAAGARARCSHPPT